MRINPITHRLIVFFDYNTVFFLLQDFALILGNSCKNFFADASQIAFFFSIFCDIRIYFLQIAVFLQLNTIFLHFLSKGEIIFFYLVSSCPYTFLENSFFCY